MSARTKKEVLTQARAIKHMKVFAVSGTLSDREITDIQRILSREKGVNVRVHRTSRNPPQVTVYL